MEIFDTTFFLVMIAGIIGGLVSWITWLYNAVEDGSAKVSTASLRFVRDTLVGAFAGVLSLFLSEAMNDARGALFVAAIAGFTGISALNLYQWSQGLGEERNEQIDNDVNAIETLAALIEENKQLQEDKKRLQADKKWLQAENDRLRLEVNLLSKARRLEDNTSTDDIGDDDEQQNQQTR